MNDLDWAYRKAREIAEDIRAGRRSGPHQLGRFKTVILSKASELLAGNDAPIRIAEDD